MRILTVFQFGAWQGCVLNLHGRIVYQSLCYETEYQARGDASRWLLGKQGRAA